MRTFKIIFLTLLIIVELILLIYLMFNLKFFDTSQRLCKNLPSEFGSDVNIVSCLGYISVQQGIDCTENKNCGMAYVYDSFYSLSFVNSVESFRISGNNIYVIGSLDYEVYDKGENKDKAFVRIPINGKLQFIDFDSAGSVPNYMKINGETGDMKLYKDFNEMNDVERIIFKDLETNKKDYPKEFKNDRKYLLLYLIAGPSDFLLLILTVIFLVLVVKNKKHE